MARDESVDKNYAAVRMTVCIDMLDALSNPERHPDLALGGFSDRDDGLSDTLEHVIKSPEVATRDKSKAILHIFKPVARYLFGKIPADLPVDYYERTFIFAETEYSPHHLGRYSTGGNGETMNVAEVLPPRVVMREIIDKTIAASFSETTRSPLLESFIDLHYRLDPLYPRLPDAS
jgi:hypothetical protein